MAQRIWIIIAIRKAHPTKKGGGCCSFCLYSACITLYRSELMNKFAFLIASSFKTAGSNSCECSKNREKIWIIIEMAMVADLTLPRSPCIPFINPSLNHSLPAFRPPPSLHPHPSIRPSRTHARTHGAQARKHTHMHAWTHAFILCCSVQLGKSGAW